MHAERRGSGQQARSVIKASPIGLRLRRIAVAHCTCAHPRELPLSRGAAAAARLWLQRGGPPGSRRPLAHDGRSPLAASRVCQHWQDRGGGAQRRPCRLWRQVQLQQDRAHGLQVTAGASRRAGAWAALPRSRRPRRRPTLALLAAGSHPRRARATSTTWRRCCSSPSTWMPSSPTTSRRRARRLARR